MATRYVHPRAGTPASQWGRGRAPDGPLGARQHRRRRRRCPGPASEEGAWVDTVSRGRSEELARLSRSQSPMASPPRAQPAVEAGELRRPWPLVEGVGVDVEGCRHRSPVPPPEGQQTQRSRRAHPPRRAPERQSVCPPSAPRTASPLPGGRARAGRCLGAQPLAVARTGSAPPPSAGGCSESARPTDAVSLMRRDPAARCFPACAGRAAHACVRMQEGRHPARD